jgi:hypothetical protein
MNYDPIEQKKVEVALLRLLDDYRHYKIMTTGTLFFNWKKTLNLYDFIQWLKSKK